MMSKSGNLLTWNHINLFFFTQGDFWDNTWTIQRFRGWWPNRWINGRSSDAHTEMWFLISFFSVFDLRTKAHFWALVIIWGRLQQFCQPCRGGWTEAVWHGGRNPEVGGSGALAFFFFFLLCSFWNLKPWPLTKSGVQFVFPFVSERGCPKDLIIKVYFSKLACYQELANKNWEVWHFNCLLTSVSKNCFPWIGLWIQKKKNNWLSWSLIFVGQDVVETCASF